MDYNIEFKFLKSKNWTKQNLLFYLKVKPCLYDEIEETEDYFLVNE